MTFGSTKASLRIAVGDAVCGGKSRDDVVIDVLAAEFLIHTEFFKSVHHTWLYARKYDLHAPLFRHIAEIPEVLHSCRINERHLSHPYYTHASSCLFPLFEFLRLRCEAEEIRTVDFINLNSLVDIEIFGILQIRLFVILGCCKLRLIQNLNA